MSFPVCLWRFVSRTFSACTQAQRELLRFVGIKERNVNSHSCSDREYGTFGKEGGATEFNKHPSPTLSCERARVLTKFTFPHTR